MFVVSNAWEALKRHPWRNLFTAVLAALAMFTGVFAQSTHAADAQVHGDEYNAQQTTAVVRPSAQTLAKRDDADPNTTKSYLTYKKYSTYASALDQAGVQAQYSFAESMPVRQNGSVKAVSGTADQPSDRTGGEFTLTALYDKSGISINKLGRFTIKQGKQLDFQSAGKSDALVSTALAERNHLKVGSTFTVGAPSDAGTSYDVKVVGIYQYTDPAPAGRDDSAKLAKNNRDNAIYTSGTFPIFATSNDSVDDSTAKGWDVPEFDIAFTMQSADLYPTFEKTVKQLGMPKGYEVSSPTLERYNESVAPFTKFAVNVRSASTAIYVLAGLAMLALLAWNLSGRRDEIGMDMVIGVTRLRIGSQLALETLLPTLLGMIVGGVAGALSVKPLGGALRAGHDITLTGDCWMAMWYGLGFVAIVAIIAFARGLAARTDRLFDTRTTPDAAQDDNEEA